MVNYLQCTATLLPGGLTCNGYYFSDVLGWFERVISYSANRKNISHHRRALYLVKNVSDGLPKKTTVWALLQISEPTSL